MEICREEHARVEGGRGMEVDFRWKWWSRRGRVEAVAVVDRLGRVGPTHAGNLISPRLIKKSRANL